MSQYKPPKHVAIVMDGNGRWAKKRFLPRIAGHKAGVQAVKKIVVAASKANIETLSLFTFSSENWKRPKEEVNSIFELFLQALQAELDILDQNNVRLRIIGDISVFSQILQKHIKLAEQKTAENTGLTLVIAANYGGQWDILTATQKLCAEVAKSNLSVDQINTSVFAEYLASSDLPDLDLFIRTSGEQRISNFFLWQLAYSELYFSPVLWPDFDEEEFHKALSHYSIRQRRFGAL